MAPDRTGDPANGGLSSVGAFIRREAYDGRDPYDGLNSPLFDRSLFRNSRFLRFAVQQTLRRSPLDFRRWLKIPRGRSPVTLALCFQAYGDLFALQPELEREYEKEMDFCLNELLRLQSHGYSGVCWGYEFPWEGKYVSLPRFAPTVVATGIVTNAIFEEYRRTRNESLFTICQSAVDFVRSDLNRTNDAVGFCFSYSPLDKQAVLNAAMFGARLMAQVYSITHQATLRREAECVIRYVVARQRPDGSWPYAANDGRTWTDGFHTGYILDCLAECMSHLGDKAFIDAYGRGLEFYLEHIHTRSGFPKFSPRSLYPIDCSCVAQSILTLTREGRIREAEESAAWMVANMQDQHGSFWYRRHRMYTNTISYMRWSNAWMFLALARLSRARSDRACRVVEHSANDQILQPIQ